MKVFAFLVSFVLFVGGILLFGYAFAFAPEWHTLTFAGGIAAISVSLMIPFHLLERLD
jgi:cytochrome b subunit of formate dehydrogenase